MTGANEIAVALRHDRDGGTLPCVTARGRGAIARQILAVAREEGIPVREDADLVAILEKLDVGSPIPVAAFAAVAEILALLYRTNRQAAGDRTPPPPDRQHS
ncbi:MAG: EscU/YscU/HrcU family type III secretion system export apparatus switch protein [Geminicoccaceae bacterium]|nr:EscU/YscU/HrcU family type III secretion system export apparatus switch protein [Geminicoccaceae bacterium]